MKYKLFSIAFASVLVLAGCQGNGNQEGVGDGTGGTRTNIQPTRFDDNINRNNRMNEGIRDDRTNDRVNDNRLNNNRTNNYPMTDNRRNDNLTNNRTNNNRTNDNRMNDNDRYEVSKEAADRITDQIDEIDYAYVLTTNNNAYVAAVLNNNNNQNDTTRNNRNDATRNNRTDTRTNRTNDDDLSEDIKREISDIVQSVDRNIDNVYVSTNPDFVDLTNNYINDFNDGRPIRGMFNQIGEMIERIFPQNRGR